MADIRETSLLFSLNRLMEHEKERVLSEQRERELKLAQERVLRERLEQQKKDAERRRMVDEERRKIAEAARLREEAARVEAIRSAEIERARAQVAQRTQLELQAKEHEHERRMDAMRRDAKLRRYQAWSLASSVVAVVLVLGAPVLYFGKLKPDDDRRTVRLEARASAQHERAERAAVEADDARTRQRSAERELGETKRKLADAQRELSRLRFSGPSERHAPVMQTRPPNGKSRPKAGGGCKPGLEGDPMNGCL